MPKLSKEAKEGMEWAVSQFKMWLGRGLSEERALRKIGLDGMNDIFFFLAYIQDCHPDLYKKLR